MSLVSLFRGLNALRNPELVRRLGDMILVERDLDDLRRLNPGTHISSDAVFQEWRKGIVRIAAGASVERGTIVAVGDAINGYGSLEVGENSWIGPNNNFRLSGGAIIRIGRDCLVSQFCTLVAANHEMSRRVSLRYAPSAPAPRDVVISDDVWIGAGAILLPGSTVASGAVIGAGSVVTRPVGAYEIWAGNPARKIGDRPE